MSESLKDLKPNPFITANPISRLFFSWLNGILKTGHGGTLEVQDMFTVCPEDRSQILGDRLERAWQNEVQRKAGTKQNPSLLRGLFSIFGMQYMIYSVILCIQEGLKVVQPVLLGSLVNYFTPEPGISQTDAYLYAMGVSLCAILQVILYHPYCFLVNRLGMQIRIACCSLMYRKCLRLSKAGFSKTTTGQIVNLMSNDVNKIDLAITLFPFLLTGPLQAITVLIILWNRAGEPMLAGIALLVLLVSLQIIMSKLFSKFREQTAKYTDNRVTIMNEIIAGMRIIKMYCWETSFRDLIADIRRSEIHYVRMTSYLSAILETISRQGSHFCIYATIVVYVISRHSFRASDLYIAVGLLNVLSMNALLFVSLAVKQAVQTAVTFGRITDFLRLEDLHMNEKDTNGCFVDSKSKFIDIHKITAKWDESSEQHTLTDVTFSVGEDQLVAIIGPVGSGKSSLLLAILKELPLTSGNIQVNGRVAYVSQHSWVYSASIKDNILFGNKFEDRKYDTILRACALDKDVAIFPHGDSTLIGDRGLKLSGGQRARISLARALYMDVDVYLLDDPFSAVDVSVARHIFENVIQGILRHKPRVLVTHSLQFLQATDQIIILQEGKVLEANTFTGLCNSGVDFASLLKMHNKHDATRETSVHLLSRHHLVQMSSNGDSETVAYGTKTGHLVANGIDGVASEQTKSGAAVETDNNDREKEESCETGTVNWRVYFKYLQAGTGMLKGLILTFICLTAQAFSICSDWWLSKWSNENEALFVNTDEEIAGNHSENITKALGGTEFNTAIYSGLIFGIFLFGLLRAFLFFKVAVDAADKLHRRMFISMIRSGSTFFDANPVGRILNRFSKDTGQVDEVLPLTLFDFLQCSLIIAGMVCVTGAVNPWVFITIIPLSVILVLVRNYYLQTSRKVQRLEGITRSPVFSHLSATLQGLHIIRAFRRQENVKKDFDSHQDVHTAAWFLFISLARWFTIRLDWICALFVITVAFCSILAADRLDAGLVGFTMTYAFAVSVNFQWTVRQSTMVENQMVSVERVLEYCKLPSEAPLETDENHKPAENWPNDGEISVSNASLKYQDESPNTLKNLTFKIYANEKVGIIGRTGAGKTSLIAMLMRLVEFEGTVTIDNINIQTIGLHDLRKGISVIPQDPVLFTGKLRKSLDPSGEHDDSRLWQVLEAVEMRPAIEALQQTLDAEVAEGGINFSVGQRQLICLARAMLRKNKILIIDEATANVDPRTDNLIQRTIRERFAQCTVLTIAHRLHAVMESDRIMVLDQGTIKEFDAPFLLLQRTNGFLYRLVKEMGKNKTMELMEMAKFAYFEKQNKQICDSLSTEETSTLQGEKSNLEGNSCHYMTHL